MLGAECMHRSMPFYIGDLSIRGFWSIHWVGGECPGTNPPGILTDNLSLGKSSVIWSFVGVFSDTYGDF